MYKIQNRLGKYLLLLSSFTYRGEFPTLNTTDVLVFYFCWIKISETWYFYREIHTDCWLPFILTRLLLQLSDEAEEGQILTKENIFTSRIIPIKCFTQICLKSFLLIKFNVFLTISLKWEQTSITATILHFIRN